MGLKSTFLILFVISTFSHCCYGSGCVKDVTCPGLPASLTCTGENGPEKQLYYSPDENTKCMIGCYACVGAECPMIPMPTVDVPENCVYRDIYVDNGGDGCYAGYSITCSEKA